MKKNIFLFLFITSLTFSQTADEKFLTAIYQSALTDNHSYLWLGDLSNKIGHRLSGSVGAEKGVQYTKQQMELLGLALMKV